MANFFKDMFTPIGTTPDRQEHDSTASTIFASLTAIGQSLGTSSEAKDIIKLGLVGNNDSADPKATQSAITSFEDNHNASGKKNTKQDRKRHDYVDELDNKFYDEDFDPVVFVLDQYPDLRQTESEAFLMQRLSFYDQCVNEIKGKLFEEIHSKEAELLKGLDGINEVDLGLTRLHIQLKTARRRLNTAREQLAEGDLRVLHIYRKRNRARHLIETLAYMKALSSKKQRVLEIVKQGDVPAAVQACISLISAIDSNPQSKRLLAVQRVRESLIKLLPSLRTKTDATLLALCEASKLTTVDAYAEILQAYKALDDAMEKQCFESGFGERNESLFSKNTQSGLVADGISNMIPRIMENMDNLVRTCIAAELLKYLDDVQEKMKEDSSSKQIELLTASQGRQLTFDMLCSKLPNTSRVSVSPSFIKRIGFAFESMCELAYNLRRIFHIHETLSPDTITITQINQNKVQFWRESLGAVTKLLLECELASFAGIKNVHAFSNLLKLVEVLAEFGKHFGGDMCLLETRAITRKMCKKYVDDAYYEKCDFLNSYLSRETWHLIQVSLESLGGVRAILHRGGKTVSRASSMEGDLDTEAMIQHMQFSTSDPTGAFQNPFSQLHLSSAIDADPSGEEDAEADLISEESTKQIRSPTSAARNHMAKQVSLTTTIVNCVARETGYFLDMMQYIPLAATEALLSLQALYDRYFYCVATRFVTIDIFYVVCDATHIRLHRVYEEFAKRMKILALKFRAAAYKFKGSDVAQFRKEHMGQVHIKTTKARRSSSTFGRAPPDPTDPFLTQTVGSSVPAPIIRQPPRMDIFSKADMAKALVAAESVRCAAFLFESTSKDFEALLPAVSRKEVAREVVHGVATFSSLLISLIFTSVARDLVRYFLRELHSQRYPEYSSLSPLGVVVVCSVEWDKLRTLQTDHSGYVEMTISCMQQIWNMLQRESEEGAVYPLVAVSYAWEHVVEEVFHELLGGYASVTACSTEGRALMSLDLATLYNSIQQIGACSSDGRAKQARDAVDAYVKACYYERAQDVIGWIRIHRHDYEAWQLRNLVLHGVYQSLKNKDAKTALMRSIDDVLGPEVL